MHEKEERLTNENFILYCARAYQNPQCHDSEEFFEDLSKVKYLKKLLTRYETQNELRTNLIINHIIILKNVFGAYNCVKILLLKLNKQMHLVKPFLVLMDIMPEKVYNVGDQDVVYLDEISMDQKIIEELRNI